MIFLVFGSVNASANKYYSWTPRTEYVFSVDSDLSYGIRGNANSWLKIATTVLVQAFADHTIRVKMNNTRLSIAQTSVCECNTTVVDGNNGVMEPGYLQHEFCRFLEDPIFIQLKRGAITSFFVSRNEFNAVTNIKKSLLVQLQLEMTRITQQETGMTVALKENQAAYHRITIELTMKQEISAMLSIPSHTRKETSLLLRFPGYQSPGLSIA